MTPLASVTWRGRIFEVFRSGVSIGPLDSLFVVTVDGKPGPLLVRTGARWDQRQGSNPTHRCHLDVPASLTRELDAWLERGAA